MLSGKKVIQVERAMSYSSVGRAPTLNINERWFLVHTSPRSERRARLHLEAQGFRTYLPEITKTIRHARQLRDVRAPLFARYLFVIVDLGRGRWLSIQNTFGVTCLVTCDGRPVPVPEGIVEAIIERVEQGSTHPTSLMVGQRVRVLSGPFADLVGNLDRLDENGRVRVLLDMMGAAVPVAIDRSRLIPAA
jgi:transcription elongation factor/antiterminator RfaH